MESQPSDHLKSPEKPPPSDLITIKTPKKLPGPSRRFHHFRRRCSPQLPEKYEMLLRFFDALDSSLKLLRLRKSIPVFSKIRVMVESISDRRFTHQHLAQLKFLLPDEIVIGKVLSPDESTRCMQHDLHLTITGSNKRKRGSKSSRLRDRLSSQLLRFVKAHPEGTKIPETELPDPFNQRKQDEQLNSVKQSSSLLYACNASETMLAQASHLSPSFSKHFCRKGSSDKVFTSNPDYERSKSVTLTSRLGQSKQAVIQIDQKRFMDDKSCCFQVNNTQASPVKSAGTSMTPVTPALKTPKLRKLIPDISIRPSCARSLTFEGPSRSAKIELQLDEDEYSDFHDILPDDLLLSLKNKEKKKAEQSTRKLMIVNLPKMFDRIQLLFHSSKSSAIRKEALIRNLTECHSDITDESEIEEQLRLLQEIIPEWIVNKFSPSGNKLCSINKALDPDILRQQLCKSI